MKRCYFLFALFLFAPLLARESYSQQQIKNILLSSYQYTSSTDFVLTGITMVIGGETFRHDQRRLCGHQGALRIEEPHHTGRQAYLLAPSPPAVGCWIWTEEKTLLGNSTPTAQKVIFSPSWTSSWMLTFYAMTLPPRLNSGTYALSEVLESGRQLWKLTVTYPDYASVMEKIPLPHLFCREDNEELRDWLQTIRFQHIKPPIALEEKQWMITKTEFYRYLEIARQCYIKSAVLLIDPTPNQPMLYGISFYNRNNTLLYSQKWEHIFFPDIVDEQLFQPPPDCTIIAIYPDYVGSDLEDVFNRPSKRTIKGSCDLFFLWFKEWFGTLARRFGTWIFLHGSSTLFLTGTGLLATGIIIVLRRKK